MTDSVKPNPLAMKSGDIVARNLPPGPDLKPSAAVLDPAQKRQEELAVALALKVDHFAKSAKEYRKGGFEGLAEIAGVKAMIYFEIASFVRQWTPPANP